MIILPLTLSVMLLILACRFGRPGLVRLATLRLRGGPLALLACLAQLPSIVMQEHRLFWLLVSATLLIIFCWLNRRRTGLMLAALGIVLNMVVMAANGGTMPINAATLAYLSGHEVSAGTSLPISKNRVLNDDVAALAWLGDRLLLPGPLAWLAAWSIGDVLLLVGVGQLLWHTMKGTDHAERTLWQGATPY